MKRVPKRVQNRVQNGEHPHASLGALFVGAPLRSEVMGMPESLRIPYLVLCARYGSLGKVMELCDQIPARSRAEFVRRYTSAKASHPALA